MEAAQQTKPTPDFKDQGNEAFKQKKWGLAIKLYTKGIEQDPNNHLLYSNRCAAWMKMSKDHKALEDAEMCIKLQPEWAKGWYRKGCALRELLREEEAIKVLHKAVTLAPKDTEIRAKYNEVKQRLLDREEMKKQARLEEQARQRAEMSEVSGEDYDKYKESMANKEAVPYSEEAILAHANEVISSVKLAILIGSAQETMGHFLLGYKADNGEQKQGKVSLDHVFDSPTTHTDGVNFLRRYCKELNAHGGCIVVKKSSVSYPQSWKSQKWKYAKKDGYFVQLESKTLHKLWFFPLGDVSEREEELPVETFGLIPHIMQ